MKSKKPEIISFTTDPATRKKLDKLADMDARTLSWTVEKLVHMALDSISKRKNPPSFLHKKKNVCKIDGK